MALVKTSSDIVTIRGRFGGVYFKTGPDGKHVQAMPRIVKYTRSPAQRGGFGPFSPFMGAGIGGFSGAAWLWLAATLMFYGGLWAAFAIAHYFTTKTGEKKHITGYNWYIHYALAFPKCERPPFWQPPHAPYELPQCITTFRDTWMYEHSPPDWPDYCPADYYWFKGWHGDYPYFGTDNKEWFLWWTGTKWALSKAVGNEDPYYTFYSTGANIFDYYWNPDQKKHAHVYIGGGEFPT